MPEEVGEDKVEVADAVGVRNFVGDAVGVRDFVGERTGVAVGWADAAAAD
jgi:hypothetical protein